MSTREVILLKTCKMCCVEKPESEFWRHKSHSDGLQPNCKSCWSSYLGTKKAKKRRNATNMKNGTNRGREDYFKKWALKKKYGMTKDQYDELSSRQNNRCAICTVHRDKCHNGLYVDHDHKTGKVRALLCRHCNAGLGHFKENPALINNARIYLQEKMEVLNGYNSSIRQRLGCNQQSNIC